LQLSDRPTFQESRTKNMNSASTLISSYVKPAIKRISRRLSPGAVRSKSRSGANERPDKNRIPQLSIVVPVYNVEGYIEETLDSLLDQTLKDWEAIVVDDGSTDSSPQIVARYAANDHRFKIVRQDNAGLGSARNTGIQSATGKFLTFLDSDDIIPPNAYELAVKCLKRTKSDFAIGAVDRIKNGKQTTPKWTALVHSAEHTKVTLDDFPDMMMDVVACNRVFNRKFWLETIGEFPVGVAYEDHRVMVTAAVRAKSIDVLTNTTYLWRIREDNTSISQRKQELQNLLDRIQAKDETFNVLQGEASQNAISAWITRLLDTDIPLFSAYAISSDQEYRDHAAAFAKRYVALADDSAWEDVRWHQRVKVSLMADHRWDELDLFLTQLRNNVDVPGTQIESGSVVLDLTPFDFDFDFLPRSRRILGPRLTSLVAQISSAEWSDDGLKLAGFALISNVASAENDEISVDLIDSKSHYQIALGQTQKVVSRVASRTANEGAFDHSSAGFETLIRWDQFQSIVRDDQLDIKNEWHIQVTRRSNSIERTTIADTVLRSGSGGAFTQAEVPNEPYSIQLHRYKRAFSIRFRPVYAELRNLVVRDCELEGQIYLPQSANAQQLGTPVAVCAQGTNQQAASVELKVADETQPDSNDLFVFEGLKLSSLPESSRLRIEFPDSSSKTVTWGLSETEYKFLPGLVLKKSPFGMVDIASGALSPVAETIECDAGVISVGIQYSYGSDQPLGCVLRSTTSSEEIEGWVVDSGQSANSVVLKFDTCVRDSSGAALHGTFSVFVDDVQVVPTVDLTRTFPHGFITDFYRVEASRGSAPAGRPLNLKFSAPLDDSEAGSWNQKRLRSWYQKETFADEQDAVLFQCYRGEVATDNQLAIHDELTKRQSGMTTYWGVADGSVPLPENAVPLIIGSTDWYRKLGSVRYLCNNIDFDHFFRRRSHQKFLQTFHGHAFKSMGISFWKSKELSSHQIEYEIDRRQDAWTTALMPNSESIEYYDNEYEYSGEYLVAGFPRNDAIVNTREHLAKSRVSDSYQLEASSSKWVLYAPTWRESAVTGAWSAKMFSQLDLDLLSESLGEDWTIMVRGHGYNSREGERIERSASIVDVTDYPEINDLILSCDVSVLDYSSLRFDWAITRKPMVFFVPDMDEYFELRPALFSFEESAPGPLTTTTAQVVDELKHAESYERRFGESLDIFNQRFNGLSDGHAAERVVDSFFKEAL
jgi:CDP-glycerol glycerophosphotransferase